MKQKLILQLLFCILTAPVFAQKGYIYLHLRNLNEESTPSTGIAFSISGTTTPPVTSVTLNDQPAVANYMYDIGASHGTSATGGDGELWVVTKTGAGASGDGAIYHRATNSSTWQNTGLTGAAVDGAGINQCVIVNSAGKAFFDSAGTVTTIWTPSSHVVLFQNISAVDISYGGGVIAIAGSNGLLYVNSGSTYPYSDNWGVVLPLLLTSTKRVDVLPSTHKIACTNGTGGVSTYNPGDLFATSLGNPTGGTSANYDVAFSDDGTVFAITSGKACYYYSGGSWTSDATGQNLLCITGGPQKQCWATNQWNYSYIEQTIYSRTCYGLSFSTSSTLSTSPLPVWIDDERVRTTCNDNSVLIPVDAGTYTITETVPGGWGVQAIDVYDPTNNSTAVCATATITVNVAAGEVVHAVVRNEKLVLTSMLKQCTANQVVDNFDTVTGPLSSTCYHWCSTARTDDGHYSVGSVSTGWPNATITDHTGSGKFMMINASFQPDEFYRKRMTNLVKGVQYTISFWLCNLSGGATSNVIYGINDSTGIVLSDTVTGSITNDLAWHNYTLTFTATTGTADVFLQNNAVGGNGNDIGLDDIALSPIKTPITSVTISPAVSVNLCIGTHYSFSVAPGAGLWTCDKSSIATIDASAGVLVAAGAGLAVVNYTYANAIGCTSDTAIAITVSAAPTVVATLKYAGTSYKGAAVCKNSADSLQCSPSGGTWPYTCRWGAWPSNAAAGLSVINTQNILCSPASAGTFIDTITVTDAVGCTATDTTKVTVSANIQPVITLANGSLACTASAVDLISTLTTAGTGPYTYSWSASAAVAGVVNVDADITYALPGLPDLYTYIVTVKDAANCLAQATQTVNIASSPSVNINLTTGATVSLCKNGGLNLGCTPSGGTAPYSAYNWSCNSSPGGNFVNAVLQNTIAKPSAAGTYNYTVTVTDSKGCIATAVTSNINVGINLSITAPTVTATVSSGPVCFSASTSAVVLTNASLTGGVSPYTYNWTGPQGCNFASPTSANTTASAAATSNFLLAVTDANGCVGSAATASITINALPVVAAASTLANICHNDLKTTLSALASGGSGGGYGNWLWSCSPSNGGIISTSSQSTDALPLSNASYAFSVTVKDGNGCTSLPGIVNVLKSTYTNPSVAISPSAGAKICGATINLTNTTTAGTGPYTYLWTGTNITDCTQPTTTATPGTTGALAYGLTVKDANLCQTTVSAGITLYTALVAKAEVSALTFCGGSISLKLYAKVSGGAGIYAYTWASASTGNGLGLANLASTVAIPTGPAGASYNYNLTVTDNAGCSVTAATSAVVQAPSPAISVTATLATPCVGQTIHLAAAPLPGDNSPYIYAWTGPSTVSIANSTSQSASCTPSTPDNYIFAVLALGIGNNCSVVVNTALVAVYSLPSISVNVSKVSVCADPASLITLSALPTGGCGSYRTYSWTGSGCTNSSTSTPVNTATPSISGTFNVSVTDTTGCVSALSVSANVDVDLALPQIAFTCGVNPEGARYGNLYEMKGSSWTWTTTSGGRFYTTANLSVYSDSDVSHIQAPYVAFMGNYNLQMTNANSCKSSTPYSILQGSCAQVLNAGLAGLKAQEQGNKVLLTWNTTTEINNDHFDIQRSGDGKSWAAIGTVKGHLNSTVLQQYSFTDVLPLNGFNYYRLKHVDADGVYGYSGIASVKINAPVWAVKLYPNPVADFVVLEFNNDKDEKAAIAIQTSFGNTVFIKDQYLVKGYNRIVLNQVQLLAQGAYIIQLKTSANIYQSKFIKLAK